MEQLFKTLTELHTPPKGLFDRISTFLVRTELKKHEYLHRKGEIETHISFIEKGILRAFYKDEINREYNIWVRGQNKFVFLISCFCNQTPSRESIVATEDSILWSITFEQLEALRRDFGNMRDYEYPILKECLGRFVSRFAH